MARSPFSKIEHRNESILKYMHSHPTVTVEELAHFLNVSEITVRRDLNSLLDAKMITRVRAGQYSLNQDPSFDVALFQRYSLHHAEKAAIARAALNLISPGSVIGLDSSTTVLELGKILIQQNLTVVTNNLFIPAYHCQHPSLHIFLAGGSVYLSQNSTEGSDTCRAISSFHYDTVFLSANAIDFNQGLSNINYKTIDAKLAYAENADRRIILLDSSKIGRCVGKSFMSVSQIDLVVTDAGITSEQTAAFETAGIPLLIAE